jgi:hypothetical protein
VRKRTIDGCSMNKGTSRGYLMTMSSTCAVSNAKKHVCDSS